MGSLEGRRQIGRHGTDVDDLRTVEKAVGRLVAAKWGGYSAADREDLQSIVLEKYIDAFGRDHRLPVDAAGEPVPPITWLKKVIFRAGIDGFRKQLVRPVDPVDFGDVDDARLNARLFAVVKDDKRLSMQVAERTDLRRALKALGASHPNDLELIWWRFVEDKSVRDIASLVQKPEGTTRKAIDRAIGRLRELVRAITEEPVRTATVAAARRVARRQ